MFSVWSRASDVHISFILSFFRLTAKKPWTCVKTSSFYELFGRTRKHCTNQMEAKQREIRRVSQKVQSLKNSKILYKIIETIRTSNYTVLKFNWNSCSAIYDAVISFALFETMEKIKFLRNFKYWLIIFELFMIVARLQVARGNFSYSLIAVAICRWNNVHRKNILHEITIIRNKTDAMFSLTNEIRSNVSKAFFAEKERVRASKVHAHRPPLVAKWTDKPWWYVNEK